MAATPTWLDVAVGSLGTCGIRTDSTLWCWGAGAAPGVSSVNSPTRLDPSTGWADVSVGEASACAIKAPGALWCWGTNGSGQLGIGTTAASAGLTQVGAATDWTAVDVAPMHVCGLRAAGTSLWCWGENRSGEVGDGSTVLRRSPVQVAGTGWTAVSAGGLEGGNRAESTCGLRGSRLLCWGDNHAGQVGDGTRTARSTPTVIAPGTGWAGVEAGLQSCAVDLAGGLWCGGQERITGPSTTLVPTRVDGTAVWRSASVDVGFSRCAISTAGDLSCRGAVGTAPFSPTGEGSTWTAVPVGTRHACALRSDATLWCWGQGDQGELGIGVAVTGSDVNWQPGQVRTGVLFRGLAASTFQTCGISRTGALWCWGISPTQPRRFAEFPRRIGAGTDWTAIAAGNDQVCGLRSPGTLWCWGGAVQAPQQVGTVTSWTSVVAGPQNTCAIRTDGSLWCWGDNSFGQLGTGSRTPSAVPMPVDLSRAGAGVTFVDVSGSCAIRTDRTLWCWGNGRASVPTRVGTASSWASLGVGGHAGHHCAARTTGGVWCWGPGIVGETGQVPGTGSLFVPAPVPGAPAGALSLGGFHTCGLASGGRASCWGWNAFGQIGVPMPRLVQVL